ncbi:MAG: nucleotidyltransferase [Balneolaceae bacterium]|nr:nucleotidyltransferase [Balneolaceae bacterium]
MKPTLIVLAAGMGSRYRGLKQLDEVGPSGEAIMDYTIYDAIQTGYGKIIFVIRESMEKAFRDAILSKIPSDIETDIVFQALDDLPGGLSVPDKRTKPWGTAHALWVAREVVQEPFAMVNADDYYGRDALQAMNSHLAELNADTVSACMVGFRLENTLSEFGSVSRGICEVDNKEHLIGIEERTQIEKNKNEIFFEEEDERHPLTGNEIASMNLIGFTPPVFQLIEEGFIEFYNSKGEDLKAEYYVPEVLKDLIADGYQVPVLPTTSQWFGVTYREDKPYVEQQLLALVEKRTYPKRLWS